MAWALTTHTCCSLHIDCILIHIAITMSRWGVTRYKYNEFSKLTSLGIFLFSMSFKFNCTGVLI